MAPLPPHPQAEKMGRSPAQGPFPCVQVNLDPLPPGTLSNRVTASAPCSFSGGGAWGGGLTAQERVVRTCPQLGSDVFPCGLTGVQNEHRGGVTGSAWKAFRNGRHLNGVLKHK